MDAWIFRPDESWWIEQAYTAPRVVGTLFNSPIPVWFKALRFYRPSTAMYGKIEIQVFSQQPLDAQNIPWQPIAGTYVTTTLTAGTGPTGWITLTLPQQVKMLRVGYYHRVVVRYPGGANNRMPRSRANRYQYAQYSIADIGYSWGSEGPLYDPWTGEWQKVRYFGGGSPKNNTLIYAPWNGDAYYDNRQPAWVDNAAPGLFWPTGPYSNSEDIIRWDWGVDVQVTDTDAAETPQIGPSYNGWGRSGPPYSIGVKQIYPTGAANNYYGTNMNYSSVVTGTDIDIVGDKDVYVTYLRVYRIKPLRGEDEVGQTKKNDTAQDLDVNGNISGAAGSGLPPAIIQYAAQYTITAEVFWGGLVGAVYEVHADGTGTYIEGSFTEFYRLQSLYSNSNGNYTGWQSQRVPSPFRLVAGKRYRIVMSWPANRPTTANWFTTTGPGANPRQTGPVSFVGRSNSTANSGTGCYSQTPGSSQDQWKVVYFPTTPTTDQVWSDITVTTKDPFLSESGGGFGDDREPNEFAQRMWYANLIPAHVEVAPGQKLCIQEFQVTSPAKAYGLRFLRPSTEMVGLVIGGLFMRSPQATNPYFTVQGSECAWQLLSVDEVQSGKWMYCPFASGPLRLSPGQTYVIAILFPEGYPVETGYFDEEDVDGRTSGVLSIPEPERSYLTPRSENNYLDVTVVPWEGSPTGNAGAATAPPAGAIRAWADLDMTSEEPAVVPRVLPSITQCMRYCSAMEFSVEAEATGHGLHFYRASEILGGKPTARVYRIQENSGTYYTEIVGADVTFTPSGTGWQYAAFRTPMRLKPGQRYLMAFYWPDGMPCSQDDYYDIYSVTGSIDQVAADADNQGSPSGLLRIPTHNHAHMGRQALIGYPSQQGDTIAYPETPTDFHMLVDISVSRGSEGASTHGQEPDGSLSLLGTRPPEDVVYLQSKTWMLPGAVLGHEFYFDVDATIHGVRWFRYSTIAEPVEVAIYRVTDRFIIGTSRQTVPAATMLGWVYIPFDSPVAVSSSERYRVAVFCRNSFQIGVGQFTRTRKAGPLTMVASWSQSGPIENPVAELEYPRFAEGSDYYLDLCYTLGTNYLPATTKTLFNDSDPQNNTVDVVDAGISGYTLGMRFSVDADVYATAIRFWRPHISVGLGGAVLGAIWVGWDPSTVTELPNSEIIFKILYDNAVPANNVGWEVCAFPYPVPLYKDFFYTVGVFFPRFQAITNDFFMTGHPGDSGTVRSKYAPKGTLWYSGVDAIKDHQQNVSAKGAALAWPNVGGDWVSNNPLDPSAGVHFVPWGDNYWVDVAVTNITPDYIQPEYPPFPLSYSLYGNLNTQIESGVGDGDVVAGMEFSVERVCWLHGYKYPRPDPNRLIKPVIAGLYQINADGSGSQIPGTFGTIKTSAGFWQRAHLKPAVRLEPGKRYKLVMQFLRAFPRGEISVLGQNGYDSGILRGPIRVPPNSQAMGGSTITWEEDVRSFVYPTRPMRWDSTPYFEINMSTFQMDMLISDDDPYGVSDITHSLQGNRSPSSLKMQGLLPFTDSTTGQTYMDGISSGLEFTVEGDQCYATEIRYWRESYPTPTVIDSAAIYEMTTPPSAQPSPSYPGYPELAYALKDNSAGTVVPGTSVTFLPWPSDPFSSYGSAAGWVTQRLPVPVKLDAGKTYRLAVFWPNAFPLASVPQTNYYWGGGTGGAGVSDKPLIAPNRDTSQGQSQSPGSYSYGFDHLTYPQEYSEGNAINYWIDIAIIDQAPRFLDGPMIIKVINTYGRERRGSGIDAQYISTPLLGAHGEALGLKEIDGGMVTYELDAHPTAFGGFELPQYSLAVSGLGLGVFKEVNGGVVDYNGLGVQVKTPRPRKAVGGEAAIELDIAASTHEAFRWAPIPREAMTEFPFKFKPQDLRFMVQTIQTRQWVHMDLPISDVTITWRLSGPFELTGKLTPPYLDVLDLYLDEWAVFIHVEYQGAILGSGIMMPWSSTWNELNIEAIGVTTYPHGIPYMDIYSKFFPDVMEVVRELWRHVQSFPNSELNVLLPDGYMGVPLFGAKHNDAQTGALLGWEAFTMTWTDLKDCGSEFDNLAASTPFDYQEVNWWNSTHTDILHGVNIGYPRLGTRREFLRFVEDENIIEAVPITEPDDAFASDIIVKGAGEGPDQIWFWIGAMAWDRLRRVYVLTDEQIQSTEVAYGIAMQELERRAYARGIASITIDAHHLNATLGSYQVGDDILIDGMQPWVGDYLLWHRITSIEYHRDTGTATLEIARSESFRYGRPRESGK